MSIKETFQRSLTVAAFALLLASPQTALAVPNRVALYDVRTVLNSDGTRGMLVAEELAPSVKLPAEVRLPVPKGARIAWAGEILGGDPSKDPSAKYATEPGGDYDTIVFSLKQARRGQVELSLPAPAAGASGTRMGITWKAPETADFAQLAVQVPRGAQISSATAGASASTVSNGVFYFKQFTGVPAGKRLELVVVYTGGLLPAPAQQQAPQQQIPQQVPPGSAAGSGPAPSQPASPVTVILALGVILGGTFYLLDKVKQAPVPTRSR
ncbi:MAG TPA: hypothetical protein VGK50_06025 [Coriobacteriia bacterium]|jgi:hypothetical protein